MKIRYVDEQIDPMPPVRWAPPSPQRLCPVAQRARQNDNERPSSDPPITTSPAGEGVLDGHQDCQPAPRSYLMEFDQFLRYAPHGRRREIGRQNYSLDLTLIAIRHHETCLKAIRKPPSRYTPTSPQQVIRTAIDIVNTPDGIDNGLAEAPS